MEDSIEILKKYITQNNFIGVDELLNETTEELLVNIYNSEFYNYKERPDHASIKQFVEFSERAALDLIKQLSILIRYGNLNENKNFQVTIFNCINKILLKKSNDTDKFGYIWQHLSNYPLLLIYYSVNISLLKNESIYLLHKLMTIKYNQRYMGRDFMDYIEITLPEAINCYHLFSNIDYINVDVYIYLPGQVNNKTTTQQILAANNRIYEYLKLNISKYFLNEDNFANYYDLYEYFLGLIVMDKRLSRYEQLPDRKIGEFAPYGRKYWFYSENGRYSHNKDTIVHKFIQDTLEEKNEILKIGFFDGERNRFNNANNYYKDLLGRLTGF